MSTETSATFGHNTPFTPPQFWELLWMKYQRQLLIGVSVLLVLILLFLGIFLLQHHRNIVSQRLLAVATDAKGWQEVIDHYPHSLAAADAMLLLAQEEREKGDIEASNRTYALFGERFPKSPLAINAILGRATNDDIAGKLVDATNTYARAASTYPASYAAPTALMSQARILMRLGKQKEVQEVLQGFSRKYPQSLAWAMMGQRGSM